MGRGITPLIRLRPNWVLANFAALVDSAEAVVVRVGFDGTEYWQGFYSMMSCFCSTAFLKGTAVHMTLRTTGSS